jgi:excisionase family DNA binding protein
VSKFDRLIAALERIGDALCRKSGASYTVREAAEYLRVSERTVYAAIRDSRLSHRRVGRSIRFTMQDLEDFQSRADRMDSSFAKHVSG